MCEINRPQARSKARQFLVGCLASLVLLSPLNLSMASGQISLSFALIIKAVVQPPAAEASTDSSSAEISKRPVSGADAVAAEVTELSPDVSAAGASLDQPSAPLEKILSVGPVKSLLPEDRPHWITLEPDYTTATHRLVVSSIPTAHESDIDANLDSPLEEALSNYVVEQFGDLRAGKLLAHKLSAAFIRVNLLNDRKSYTAELSTSSGGMFQKWVMVEISAEQREQLQAWYREQVQRERVMPLGLGVAALLSGIGLLNMVFRKAAHKAIAQTVKLAAVDQLADKPSRCNPKFKWGLAVAIAIATAAAILVD